MHAELVKLPIRVTLKNSMKECDDSKKVSKPHVKM